MSDAATGTSQRRIVVYDDDCGMCTRAMRFVAACDWLGRLEAMPYPLAAARFPEVAAHELDEGMQVRMPDGTVHVALDAVRVTMLNTPPGWLVGWLLWLPGIRQLGDRAYAAIAARRTRGQCRIDPPGDTA